MNKTSSGKAMQPQPVVCVTGTSQADLTPVFECLVNAGLVRAVPSEGRKSMDLRDWHEQALAQLPADRSDDQSSEHTSSAASLGRFWDQLASDIFVANFEAESGNTGKAGKPWGWADANSIELLSYWASFHPQIRFLLIVSTPHQILADLLDDCGLDSKTVASPKQGDDADGFSGELPDLLDALRAWQWRTESALAFYHRHGSRTELLWADQAIKYPQALVERMREQWGCGLDAASALATVGSVLNAASSGVGGATGALAASSDSLNAFQVLPALSSLAQIAGIKAERDQIVVQVLSMLPEVMSLYHELLATVPMLGDEDVVAGVLGGVVDGASAGSDGHPQGDSGIAAIAQIDDLPILSLEDDIPLPDALLARIVAYQARLAQLMRVKQESEAAVEKLEAQLTAQTQSAKAEVEKAVARVKEAEEENELLLAQLHQVQEELEKYFLKAQESEKATAELAGLKKEKEAIAKQLKEAEAKLHQADKKHKEAVAKLELEVKEAKASKDLQVRLKDTEEENDLLLAQLHQVQEELERYFLRAQELEQISEEEQSRWQNLVHRLANRYSGLCDFKGMELIESESTESTHVWQISDYIDTSGREIPRFKFELLSQDGFVGFGFVRSDQARSGDGGNGGNGGNGGDSHGSATAKDADQGSALLFWPVATATEKLSSSAGPERFEVVPGRTAQAVQRLATNLDALSASDWAFLKTLTDLMIEQYQQFVDESAEALIDGQEDSLGGEESPDDQDLPDQSTKESRGGRWANRVGAASTANSANSANSVNAANNAAGQKTDDQIDAGEGMDDDGDSEPSSFLLPNPDLWLKGLQQFAALLEKLSAVLRFDSVSVTSSAEEGDYAHLVLSLSNLVTERGTFPEFQFRVATVSSGSVFDANPRLEFPRRTGEDVFERWFVESSNAFGENLEIRFAKQDSLVDLPLITARLKDADRQLVAQLIERLPSVILRIKHHVEQVKGHSPIEVDDAYSSRAQFGGQAKKRRSEPVTLAPAVGRLSDKDLDNWLQVTTTMRSIWRAQVRF